MEIVCVRVIERVCVYVCERVCVTVKSKRVVRVVRECERCASERSVRVRASVWACERARPACTSMRVCAASYQLVYVDRVVRHVLLGHD